MFIDQQTIYHLSPSLVRALRATLYTGSLSGRYSANVESTLRAMNEHRLADWLKREAQASMGAARTERDEARMSAQLAELTEAGLYDLSREYTPHSP